IICISKLNKSTNSQTIVFFLCHTRPNRNTVSSILLKLLLNSVLNSVSCSQKHHQNNDTGSHRKSGQKRTQFVFGQFFKYLVPSFNTKHTGKLLPDLLICQILFVRLLNRQFS